MVVANAELMIAPALIMGAIIGIIEVFFVHADESHMGWIMHSLHALPVTIFFVFVSMNVGWALSLVGSKATETPMIDLGVRAGIAILAMIKIAGAAAVAGRIGEKPFHIIALGILIFAAPYIWIYALGQVITPFLPAFLQ